jgi:hypothetical protein
VSDYGLDDWGSIPDRGRGFFLYPVCPDRLWAHPASCPVGTKGPFRGGKARPGRDVDYSSPSNTKVKNE